jgi:ureidoacrylate peracid hydrolase
MDSLLSGLAAKADPAQAGLLVIDVQNDFAAEGGFFHKVGADIAAIQSGVLPRLRGLIDGARAAGVPVIFVRAIYDPPVLSAPMRERNERLGMTMPRCISGSWGAEFCGVAPEPGEAVVTKHRYSAMVGTSLRDEIDRRGIRSLLLAGIATDTCVESTGRDLYFRDYYVTVISDCCGAHSQADHAAALRRFDRDYGETVPAEAVLSVWNGAAART